MKVLILNMSEFPELSTYELVKRRILIYILSSLSTLLSLFIYAKLLGVRDYINIITIALSVVFTACVVITIIMIVKGV